MPRLRVFSARDLCDLLREHGFAKVRQAGCHIVMRRQTSQGRRTVIVPNHADIRRGTLKSIIEQSGLARELFLTG